MANLQGYTTASIDAMLDHYTRHDGDKNQAQHTYQNQNIDPSRTHLNQVLSIDGEEVSWHAVVPGGKSDAESTLNARISSVDRKPGKNTNVLSDWVLTLPRRPEFDDDDAARNAGFKGSDAARQEFFNESFLYLANLVGRENVVGAWIHLDETRPHMHFAFTPITKEPGATVKGKPLYWSKQDEKKYANKKWTQEEAERFKSRVWTEADAKNFPSAPIEIGTPRCVAGMPKCVAGMPKLDSKCSPRFARAKKKDAKPVTRFAQSVKFDQDALRAFHDDLADHLNSVLEFDVGITIGGEDELSKLDRSLSHLKDQQAYGRAKEAVNILRGNAEAARSEILLAGEGLKTLERRIESEQRRLESLQQTREDSEKRVARLEALRSECRSADDAPIGAKSVRLDAIAARCAGWLSEIKDALAAAAKQAISKLKIGFRGDAADIGTTAVNAQTNAQTVVHDSRWHVSDSPLIRQPSPSNTGRSHKHV